MQHAASLDLEDFEDADLQDKLDRARRQVAGRSQLLSQLLGQAQDVVTIVSFAIGLFVYAPWLILLVMVAVVPAFAGELHFNAQSYAVNYQWTPERRELDYLRMVGASTTTAKEVKSFGLNAFLIDRYRDLSQSIYRANRAVAVRRASWGGLFTTVGTIGYTPSSRGALSMAYSPSAI
jgi:ATP-binding cassette subfamily B protein